MARTTTTSKKSAPKKTTAKKSVTANKTVAAKAVAAKPDYYLGQTRLIKKISAALFPLLAIAAAVLMNDSNSVFSLGYMVRDQIGSQLAGQTVFAPAMRTLWEVPTKWLLVALLLTSTVFALLHLTRWRARFEAGVNAKVQPTRWLEIGVTGALMLELIALLSGVTDVMTLKLAAALVLAAAGFGWLAERENAGQRIPVWRSFILGVIAVLVALSLIKVAAISTLIFGMIRAPWYVYALYAVLLVGFLDIVLNQWLRIKQKRSSWQNGGFVERNFALVSLITKTLFAAILIIGLKK